MKIWFDREAAHLVRSIEVLEGDIRTSSIEATDTTEVNIDSYEKAWLCSKKKPVSSGRKGEIRAIDLFCGCGGLSLGVSEACRALEYQFTPILAADIAENALSLYERNFQNHISMHDPIERIIDGELGDPLSESEKQFVQTVGSIDMVIGGPPCQGNSDLNNHTRRTDPRNLLYLKMVRCVEILKPQSVIIENVPGVQHDTHSVVQLARQALIDMGYTVDSGTMDMSTIGIPQKRKRFFMIASLKKEISFQNAIISNMLPTRNVSWAINDLLDVTGESVFDTTAHSSSINQERMQYLFDHDLYDLPNSERPDCHRLKQHSYNSVYGRMHWDAPAPTITGGFGSNGQGRFVHPMFPRTITPHEAARIQFFPDYFIFSDVKRRELQQIIGNAVPAKASYVLGIELLK